MNQRRPFSQSIHSGARFPKPRLNAEPNITGDLFQGKVEDLKHHSNHHEHIDLGNPHDMTPFESPESMNETGQPGVSYVAAAPYGRGRLWVANDHDEEPCWPWEPAETKRGSIGILKAGCCLASSCHLFFLALRVPSKHFCGDDSTLIGNG